MAERLNYGVVEDKLSSFNSSCDSLYNALKELDSTVSATLSGSGSAIRGRLANSLLKDWDNNCACFLNFKGLFDEWHSAAVDICSQNAQFEQESVEATEGVYKLDLTGGDGGAA
jgi:hypothetical protein